MSKLKIGDKVLAHLIVVDVFSNGKFVRLAEKEDQYGVGLNVHIENVTCITDTKDDTTGKT